MPRGATRQIIPISLIATHHLCWWHRKQTNDDAAPKSHNVKEAPRLPPRFPWNRNLHSKRIEVKLSPESETSISSTAGYYISTPSLPVSLWPWPDRFRISYCIRPCTNYLIKVTLQLPSCYHSTAGSRRVLFHVVTTKCEKRRICPEGKVTGLTGKD